MIIIKQNGIEMSYASEAAYIAAVGPVPSPGAPSPGNARIRRQRRRQAALRFYFRAIKAGGNHWPRIAAIHAKAPKLTERIAKEYGFPDIGKFIEPNVGDEGRS